MGVRKKYGVELPVLQQQNAHGDISTSLDPEIYRFKSWSAYQKYYAGNDVLKAVTLPLSAQQPKLHAI